MRILFISKGMGIGGADKKLLIFAKYLIKMYKFECAFLTWPTNSHKTTAIGAQHLFYNNKNDVLDRINSFKPDIIHTTRSGEPEPNFDDPLREIKGTIPIVESNVFGKHGGVCDYRLAISSEVAEKLIKNGARPETAEVLWNSIDYPKSDIGDLRKELNINPGAFVFGRISRSDNGIYGSMEAKAYAKFVKDHRNGNNYYISLGTPPKFASDVRGLPNVIYLPESSDDKRVAKFYNTIDVLLHTNNMGESLGTKIQEAMSYGIPIVTHKSRNTFNAHITDLLTYEYEHIAVDRTDVGNFYKHMLTLYKDEPLRKKIEEEFKKRSKLWMPDAILPKLKRVYEKLIKGG